MVPLSPAAPPFRALTRMVLALLVVILVATAGCNLLGKKPGATPPAGSTAKGVGVPGEQPVTTPTTTTPTPETPAEPGQATLNILDGNPAANGARYKLYRPDGTVETSGTIPAKVTLPAESRFKLEGSRDGYQEWEGWQILGKAGSTTDVAVSLDANLVSVATCDGTGKRANAYCPVVSRRSLRPDQLPGWCTAHRALVAVNLCTVSGRRATRRCPQVITRNLPADQLPGYCTVHGAPDLVTVRMCADTGTRANQYCPRVRERQLERAAIPGYCTLHKKPVQDTAKFRLCAESGQRANEWCPNVIEKQLPRGTQIITCRTHHKPQSSTAKFRLCADSGQRANDWCPNVIEKQLPRGTRIITCRTHHKPRSATPPPPSGSTSQPEATPKRDTAKFRLCADSGQRANRWCPNVIEKQLPRGTRIITCRTHHKPRGGDSGGSGDDGGSG